MKKQAIFYISIALILIAVIVATCNVMDSPTVPSIAPNTTTIIQSELKKVESRYQQRIQSLKEENKKLSLQVEQDKIELQKVRQKTSVMSNKVRQLSEKVKIAPDTSSKLFYCDSLREQVQLLLDESIIKDELCDQSIKDLTELAMVKDSIITTTNTKCEELQDLLKHSLNEQEQLTEQVNALHKKLKKKDRRQKLLSVGVLILSGVSSALLLSNR
jgi:hypothetical protein